MSISSEDARHGLVVALWESGDIVRSVEGSRIGEAYVKGTIDQRQLDDVIQKVQDRVVGHDVTHASTDAGYTMLAVRISGAPKFVTDETPVGRQIVEAIRDDLMRLPGGKGQRVENSGQYVERPQSWLE